MHDVLTVFLVGGKGTRLGLGDKPKPLVPIDGVPLLERMVRQLADQGIRRFMFLAGFGASQIEDHFGDGSRFGVSIEHCVEPRAVGTAGALDFVRDKLSEPFLVIYGDVLFSIDVERFVGFAERRGGLGTLYAHPNDHPFDSDLLRTDGDARITDWFAKPHRVARPCRNLVNAGVAYFTPQILDHVPRDPEEVVDWGRDLFPKIVAEGGSLYAYSGSEYIKDIGTPDRVEKGERHFRSGRVAARSYLLPQRAVFLDRDGVINVEIDGVYRPEDLKLLPGAAAAIARLNASGLLAICVTNQPGLAKGFMSFDDLEAVHIALDAQLAEEGAYLDDLFYCPHHPESGWEGEVPELKIDCECRKPKAGMLQAAAARHNIDLKRSFMIGDHRRDLEAGALVGARLFGIGDAPTAFPSPSVVLPSLDAAIDVILKDEEVLC